MMDESHLAREGVKKLMETPSGRDYLSRLRKKYERDLIQPGDPRFKQVYGKQIERQKEQKRKNEDKAREMWCDSQKRKERDWVRKIIL